MTHMTHMTMTDLRDMNNMTSYDRCVRHDQHEQHDFSSLTSDTDMTKMTETEMNNQLNEIADEIADNPEAGAKKLLDLTENVGNFSEEAVDNFATMVLDIIDNMEKPISAAASMSLMDSMTNMLRKVFKNSLQLNVVALTVILHNLCL